MLAVIFGFGVGHRAAGSGMKGDPMQPAIATGRSLDGNTRFLSDEDTVSLVPFHQATGDRRAGRPLQEHAAAAPLLGIVAHASGEAAVPEFEYADARLDHLHRNGSFVRNGEVGRTDKDIGGDLDGGSLRGTDDARLVHAGPE